MSKLARDGGLEEVRADKEVLLAAGGYGSPQLLMLSGIGPAEDLKMLQIEPRENLPVGHNLQDHPVAGITLFTDVETLFTALKPENIELLQKEGRGPLTSNVAEAGGFARTRAGLSAPDIQYYFVPAMFYDEGLSAPVRPRVHDRHLSPQADEQRQGVAQERAP